MNSRIRELRTRFFFGPLMGALVVLIFWLDRTRTGGHVAATAFGLLALAGVHEYVTMFRKAGFAVHGGLLGLATLGLCVSAFFFGWHSIDHELYPLTIGTLALLFPLTLRSLRQEYMARGLEEQGATLLGFTWIAWPLFFAQGMALRHVGSVLFVLIVCKGGDTLAYLSGVTFGRRKLIPHISPGKTIEGAVGGMLGSVLLALLFAPLVLLPEIDLSLTGTIGAGIMLNVTTQTGDLVESLLKRRCGAKDSSTLLPAHGGVLDLVDSLLFSFPAWFLVLVRLT